MESLFPHRLLFGRPCEVKKLSNMEEEKQRQVKSILEKLNALNVEQVSEQIKHVGIDSAATLDGLVSQIHDEALKKPILYASLCLLLSEAAGLPEFSDEGNENISLRRLLVNKCQVEFEREKRKQDEANRVDEEKEKEEVKEARRRRMGNVQLIGELFRAKMLPEKMLNHFVEELVGEDDRDLDEDDLVALKCILSTNIKKWRQLKFILKELNSQNIEEVSQRIKNVNIDNRSVLFNLVYLIYNRAVSLEEPGLYANLCFCLAEELPEFIDEDNKKITFKRMLLNKCQEEFERGNTKRAEANKVKEEEESEIKRSEEEKEKKKVWARKRMLGNISLIGELCRKRMLPERLAHYLVQELLGEEDQNPDEDVVEALCILMSTIGEMIDHPKMKIKMDSYFDRMMKLSNNEKLSSGVRSMLRDVIELREKRWQKVNKDSEQGCRWSPGSSSSLWARRGRPMDYGPRGSALAFSPRTHQQRGGFRRLPPPSQWRKMEGPKRVEEVDWNLKNANDSAGCVQRGSSTETEHVSAQARPEEHLREMSIAAIREFYSAKSEKEVVLCIKELNSPCFYPDMVSQWVIDSFERKEIDRDLLVKLLINLIKSKEIMLSQEQLIKGFESVLSSLGNAVTDAHKSAEYLSHILAKLILENVVSLEELGRLMQGGDEPGRPIQTGLASEILGSILEIIRTEKGDSELNVICTSLNLRLEDFQPPASLQIEEIRCICIEDDDSTTVEIAKGQ